jgi:hypothetical protein
MEEEGTSEKFHERSGPQQRFQGQQPHLRARLGAASRNVGESLHADQGEITIHFLPGESLQGMLALLSWRTLSAIWAR